MWTTTPYAKTKYIDERFNKRPVNPENKGLAEFIYNTENCRKCGAPMQLLVGCSENYFMKCSACRWGGLISIHILNVYLDKKNAKCAVCGKDLFAFIGRYRNYVKCCEGHITGISDLA